LEPYWNATGTPLEYHWKTSVTPLEHHRNSTVTSLEYHWNTTVTPLEHHRKSWWRPGGGARFASWSLTLSNTTLYSVKLTLLLSLNKVQGEGKQELVNSKATRSLLCDA
jgi:hypothetical protein